MDESPKKKAANAKGFPRRQSGLSVKDGNHEAGSSQRWKRLSCSRKLDYTNRKQITGNPKTAISPSHASTSKDGIGTEGSCKLISNPTSLKRTTQCLQTSTEVNVLSNRNRLEPMKQPTSTSTPLDVHTVASEKKHSEDMKASQNSPLQNKAPEGQNIPATHPPRIQKTPFQRSDPRIQKTLFQRSDPRIQKTLFQRSDLGSHSHGSLGKKFISRHSAPAIGIRESSMTTMSGSPRASSSRYSNMNCSSSSDVPPSRFSISRSGELNRHANESPARDSSTLKGKKIASSSSTATNNRINICRQNVSFTSSPLSLEPRRTDGRCSTIRDRIRSTRSRQVTNDIGNMRSEGSTSTISLPRTRLHSTQFASQLSNHRSSIDPLMVSPSSAGMHQLYLESYEASESDEMAHDRASTELEGSSSLGSHGPSQDEGGYRHFNWDGVAEVLFALERIDQDEELTYEQLLVLETNLFLGGLAFHDRHRDMRMDIDHMTYEELLALEEKMGSVSTAVSEEALSKCLRKSLYSSYPAVSGTRTCEDDVKCSICQEEYADQDEVAHLPCDHRYHLNCIIIWLRLKNWCPICKAPVV